MADGWRPVEMDGEPQCFPMKNRQIFQVCRCSFAQLDGCFPRSTDGSDRTAEQPVIQAMGWPIHAYLWVAVVIRVSGWPDFGGSESSSSPSSS